MRELLDTLTFPPHVREAIDAGKLWRAKEILRGRIGSLPFSPDLYEQYGAVLLAMDDALQAGKYLFISGRRRPEYDVAIDIFLTRHGTRGGRALASSFPSRAKSLPLDALPPVVATELVARGLPEKEARQSVERAAMPLRTRALPWIAATGCFLTLLTAVASAALGLPILLGKILSLFR